MADTRHVKVKYVNHPKKEGGKYGNIKVDGDELIWVPVDQLRLFQQGQSYEIEIKRQKWGENWVDILDKIIYGGGGREANGDHRPQQERAQAAPVQARNQWQTGEAQRDIFITGVVGRAMGSGKFGPDDLKAWTKAAVDAWFSAQVYIAKMDEDLRNDGEEPPPPPQQRRSGPQQDFSREPDDEIPF